MSPVERQNQGGNVYAFRVSRTTHSPTRYYAARDVGVAAWEASKDGGGRPVHIIGISQAAHQIARDALHLAREQSAIRRGLE